MVLLLYILTLAALVVYAPQQLWDSSSREFVILLGVIGAWRYSWGLMHFVRSLYYRLIVFRRYRRASVRLAAYRQSLTVSNDPDVGPAIDPEEALHAASELFVIVTSYRIASQTTYHAFRSIFEEARNARRRVTIIASVVETGDQRFVKQLFDRSALPAHVSLLLVKLPGVGKRDALGVALNAVARRRPMPNALVAVMDGDTIMLKDTIERTVPLFDLFPSVGGLTTDEDSVTAGSRWMAHWHKLRFAQRQILMSSMALSGRVLTMTGRFSVFRASLATDPRFVKIVREDRIKNWRFGDIKLLTGEDKSTWFWLIREGWQMLYVPDTKVLTVEHPPSDNFFVASSLLMMRWFGNMLRANGRAIALGPQRCGWFVWLCLIDQRLSMWTPLIGPTAVVLTSIFYSIGVLYAYLIWLMATRLIQTLMLLSARPTISGWYPPLIYYSQVYGALIKTYVMFRPHVQRWTRQAISNQQNNANDAANGYPHSMQSHLLHGLALACLVTAVAFLLGLLQWPSALTFEALV